MGSLNGTIRNAVGDPLTARITLVPADEAAFTGGEVRLGGTPITLATDGTFNLTDVPDGTYRLVFGFYNPPSRDDRTLTTPSFEVDGTTALEDALGLGLLTGPQTLVIKLDTDGQPYFVTDGTGTYSVFIDTDGQPYYALPPGGEDVYFDVDGQPAILTLT